MSRTATIIGPHDHGRWMRLEEFELAEGQPGRLYELGRGIITVVDVPNRKHLAQLNSIRRQLTAYDLANPGAIYAIAGGMDCKILVAAFESERHPDLSVYKTPPPPQKDLWANWIPELVVEIISPGSEHRDYVEKRDEYLQFGIGEYWIVDFGKREMLGLRRSADAWVETLVRPGDVYRPQALPGFEFLLAPVFAAADTI